MLYCLKKLGSNLLVSIASLTILPSLAADDGSQLNESFRINYAGYLPQATKTALYLSNNSGPINWSLDGTQCSGTEDTYVSNDISSGDSFYIIDFSQCTELGNNLRLTVNSNQSAQFDISSDPYGNIKYEFFDYFKDHEDNNTFNQSVNNWSNGLNINFDYVKDAGDNGAYPTNTAESAWALINMLETYPQMNTYYSSAFNGARSVYDQLVILTDQFNHVFDHGGDLAIAKFHTNVNETWATCTPHFSGNCISEPETKATFATARTLAAMARLHDQYGTSEQSTSAYQTAKNAYQNASTQSVVCNQSDSFGGEGGFYPDNDNYSIYRNPKIARDHCVADRDNTQDDQYSALVELFLAANHLGHTGDAATYRATIIAHVRFNEASSYSWSRVAMEGNLSLLTHENNHNIDLATFKLNVLTKSDEIIGFQNEGYPGVTWDPRSNFWDNGDQDNADNNVRWGSHRNALNDARILMAAAEIQKRNNKRSSAAEYARAAIRVLDHMSGLNAMALTMYTASGYSQFEHAVERTHDGSDPMDNWAGKLVLGPNNWTNADDGDMPEFNSQPGLKMFAVNGTGWASREISIDANASLVPVAYFTTEVAPAILAASPIGGLPDPVNIPAQPENASYSNLTDHSVQLNWIDQSGNNDDAAIEFRLYQHTSNAIPLSSDTVQYASKTTWQINGLLPDTTYYFWIVASNDLGQSQPISISITTKVAAPVENLVSNGGFENAESDWLCHVDTGNAQCKIEDGLFQVLINDGGTQDWHIQPTIENITLLNGMTYTLAFDAMADSTRTVGIKVERAESPWDDFSQTGSGQTLNTLMQRFSYTFTMNETVTNARLVLNVGGNDNDVILDNIWLVESAFDPCNAMVGCTTDVENFDITVYQPVHGAISPASMTVASGSTQSFSVDIQEGYKLVDVLINSISQSPQNPIVVENISSDMTIAVTIAPVNGEDSFDIDISVGPNGSADQISKIVSSGEDLTVNITPNLGYRIAKVILNEQDLGAVNVINLSDIISDQSIDVYFELIPEIEGAYSITVSGSTGGALSSGNVNVEVGQSFTFYIAPNDGYQISEIRKNGNLVNTSSMITFSDIGSNQSLSVSFIKTNDTHSVAVSVSGAGSVTPNINSIKTGDSAVFKLVPAEGHYISKVYLNSVEIEAQPEIVINEVISSQSLVVIFSPNETKPSQDEDDSLFGMGNVSLLWLLSLSMLLFRRIQH
ncbi:carbohydrate binding domain-containing protein [Marinicellulosiphila megalodicopiae]|uniref:carbohydrate binding domain-containing protein n=1 Tax=Marinicellulosiphila megalodicopiae TaxID=2724896 RepID=UPI003BAF9BB8